MSDSFQAPPAYRAYVMEPGGGIAHVHELSCDTDERALQAARAHVDGNPIELWDRSRRIAVLSPLEPADPPPERRSPSR